MNTIRLLLLFMLAVGAEAQIASPTFNPFQNNGFQNNGFQNNGLNNSQQQGNNQPQLFTRRFHLNNGYLYGRPTLWFDAKSGKMQPWVRKNLR